jgi:DNA-binding response OmpR family regulator
MDGRPKILIVEDNADLVEILEQLLSVEYDVRTARRGEDGVTLATSFRPDVVILDMQLPQMQGVEAGRWIKRELDSVRILVLTAVTGAEDEQAIMASGCCDAYMSKPAPLDAIRAAVSDLLGSAAGTAGTGTQPPGPGARPPGPGARPPGPGAG